MKNAEHGEFLSKSLVRTLGNPGSQMWLCTNRTPPGGRLRHEVGDLDGHPPVHAHLLHHLVEEVFSLGVGARLEDRLEVVQEGKDVRPVERWEAEVLRLHVEFRPVGFELP
jgi:hypothetical protein